MHTASASVQDFSSLPIPCPLVSHHPILSTTPPSFPLMDHSYPVDSTSSIPRPSHPYNLCPRFLHPYVYFDSSELGLTSPSYAPKSTRGCKFHMSKAIILVEAQVASGRQPSLEQVLRALNTLPKSPP